MTAICMELTICIFLGLLSLAWSDKTADLTMKKIHEINLKNEIAQFKAGMLINSNWEENLMATPLAVNMLSLLALIASTNDFSMHVRPQATFELEADTFQAAIVQLSNAATLAFEKARENAITIEKEMDTFLKLINLLIDGLRYKDKLTISEEINLLHQLTKRCSLIAETIFREFHSTMILIEEIEDALGREISENSNGLKKKSMVKEWKHFKKLASRARLLRNHEKAIEITNEELKTVENVFTHKFENISFIEREILDILRPNVNAAVGLISSEKINRASLLEDNEKTISNLQRKKLSNQISYHIASSMVELLSNIQTQLRQIRKLPGIIRLPTEYLHFIKFTASMAKVTGIVEKMLSSLEGGNIQGFVTRLLTSASQKLAQVNRILKHKPTSNERKFFKLTKQIAAIKYAFLAISSQSLVKNNQSPFKSVFKLLVGSPSFVQPNEGLIAEMQHRLQADLRRTMRTKNLNLKRQIEKQTSFIERSARRGLKSMEPKDKMFILKNLFEKMITVEKSWMHLADDFKLIASFLDFGMDKNSDISYRKLQKRRVSDFDHEFNRYCMNNPECILLRNKMDKFPWNEGRHTGNLPWPHEMLKNFPTIPPFPTTKGLPGEEDGHIDYPPVRKPDQAGKPDRKPKIHYPAMGQNQRKEPAFVFDMQATTERLLKAAAFAQNVKLVCGAYIEISMMFVSDQLIEIPKYVLLVKSEIQPKLDQLISRNADALSYIQREAAKQSNLFEEFIAKSEKERTLIYNAVGEPSKKEKEAIDIGVKLKGERVDYTKALGKYCKEIPCNRK